MPKFVDRILQCVDRIETHIAFDRPPPRLVALDQCDQHFELVPLFGALRCAPTGIDLGERRAVILVVADGPDVHERSYQ